ncbi:SDR family oxidoreductase [Pontibacter sp. 13R65]|uniref:NAD-dependent epimerase/dehydratase family protein n=1 Tax=Pontibacter sp. 13R65 TaxID=3127458 RepID=UPI00301D7796
MRILITGNLGYLGTGVVMQLRTAFPEATLIGYDMAYFASSASNSSVLPEKSLDEQVYGDVRNMPAEVLDGVDAVVHLAALPEDLLGQKYDSITKDVNYTATIRMAELAKAVGVEAFVFASTCSMYGAAEESDVSEFSDLNPISNHAAAKLQAELDLEPLAGDGFSITCLRFPTACGMSDKPRLGLLLNDMVAEAITTGSVRVSATNNYWQPLLHVQDMARAIEWAVTRDIAHGGEYLIINAGSNSWNFRTHDLGQAVAEAIPGTMLHFTDDEVADNRSYKVNFDLFKALAPNHQPLYTLTEAIAEMRNGLSAKMLNSDNAGELQLNRLLALNKLEEQGLLDHQLRWAHQRIVSDRELALELLD